MLVELTQEQIQGLLREARFARLGCHAGGKTYVVPISYAYDGTRLLGQTTLGMKIEMMRENPEVCVEIDFIEDLTEWKSVIVWGRYEELTGMAAVEARGLLIDKYGDVFEEIGSDLRLGREIAPPRLDRQPQPEIVYAIHPTQMTGRAEGKHPA